MSSVFIVIAPFCQRSELPLKEWASSFADPDPLKVYTTDSLLMKIYQSDKATHCEALAYFMEKGKLGDPLYEIRLKKLQAYIQFLPFDCGYSFDGEQKIKEALQLSLQQNDDRLIFHGYQDVCAYYNELANHGASSFYPGASNELMRINGNGNVGIGTNSPTQKLQVQGSAYVTDKVGIGVASPNSPLQFTNALANRKIVLHENGNNDNQFYGLGVNAGQLRYQVDATASSHVFYAGTGSGASNELVRIKGNGNVGIGTNNPNSPLQFSNALANRKIVIYESDNNDHQYHGFGVGPAIMRYQVGETTSDHVFFAGASSSASNELMRVKGNGNVGIGTNNPTAKLDVQGNENVSEVKAEEKAR